LAVASFQWLYRYYSSGEQAHLAVREIEHGMASPIESDVVEGAIVSKPNRKVADGRVISTWEIEDPRTAGESVQLAQLTIEQIESQARRRFQQARATVQSFRLLDPTAFDSGLGQLSQIRLNQKIDSRITADAQWKRLVRTGLSPIADVAQKELAILKQIHKPAIVPGEVTCHPGQAKPRLDGLLTDSLWLECQRVGSTIKLHPVGPDGSKPSEHLPNASQLPAAADQLMVASDDEYLYLAVRCRQSSDFVYESTDEPRGRDDQLLNRDRVEIMIDTDRDFESYFLLTVDSAGRVADSVGNNLNWNPTWFVANRQIDGDWIVEIAIPLAELPLNDDFWRVAASRHIRNRMVASSWNGQTNRAMPAIQAYESVHRAAIERKSGTPDVPLSAFRWVRMPWAETVAKGKHK